MMPRRACLAGLLALPIAPVLSGCASGSPVIHWHSLVATDDEPIRRPASLVQAPVTLVVGPATVPDEVDRSPLVVHVPARGVLLLDNERWTAPLKSQLPRAVAFGVGRRIPGALVGAYPNTALPDPRWRLLMDVERFELRQGTSGGAWLRVLWTLRANGPNAPAAYAQVTDVSVGADPAGGIDGLVAAMQAAVEQLAADVGSRLCTLGAC